MAGTGQAAARMERMGSVVLIGTDAGVAALAHALRAAAADAGVAGIVLLCDGPADEAEAAASGDLALAIEAAGKPVVAALRGEACDALLEVALAADARLAEVGARLGFRGIARGLLPWGGATQRLPRRVGVAAALDLLGSGRMLTAEDACEIGLLDAVLPDREALVAAALALASDLAGSAPVPPEARGDGLRDAAAALAAVAAARAAAATAPLEAARRIVDCVEAALVLPFAQGLAFEAAARADVLALPEVASLRWLARAEARHAGVAPLRAVAVAAAGGVALTVELLAAGREVTLVGADRTGLIAGLELVAATQSLAVEAGRMTEAAREADWARLTPALEVPAGLCVVQDTGGSVTLRRGAEAAQARLQGGLAEVQGDLAAAVFAGTARVVLPVGGPVLAPLRDTLAAVAAHEAARAGRAPVEAALARFGQVVAALPDGGRDAPGPLAERILAALANAGLRLIGDGVVDRPGDIDLALVAGAGWPRHCPGPMLWAVTRGLMVLRADLRRWQAEAPPLWSPAPMIDAMMRRGARLEDLEG